jgi:hypothetical protein
MSDRLALAEAIEDAAGIDRAKAVKLATAIFDAIHTNVATKTDLDTNAAVVRGDFAELRGEVRSGFARQDVAIERLRSTHREMESRITVRLGGMIAAGVAIIVVLQHLWR